MKVAESIYKRSARHKEEAKPDTVILFEMRVGACHAIVGAKLFSFFDKLLFLSSWLFLAF